MHKIFAVLFALLIALPGCDQQTAFDALVPKAESEFAKHHLAQLAAKDFTSVESRLDASLIAPDTRLKLEQMAQQFPASTPTSVATIGAHTNTVNDTTTYNLSYEYEYPKTWLVANVVLQRRGTDLIVLGTHVNPATQSLKDANRFNLSGKGALHYLVLAMAICVPLFIVYSLVLCFRTTFPKRKWLWVLFVGMGLVQVSLNWTTGAFGIQPLSFLLLGGGFVQAGPYAPVILTFALPIGALIFLYKRRSLKAS